MKKVLDKGNGSCYYYVTPSENGTKVKESATCFNHLDSTDNKEMISTKEKRKKIKKVLDAKTKKRYTEYKLRQTA